MGGVLFGMWVERDYSFLVGPRGLGSLIFGIPKKRGHPQVTEQDRAVVVDEEVRRFDVTMHQAVNV